MKYRLLSWNVNGIRAIYKKGMLDFLQEEKPDALCIQETKAHEEQLVKKLLNPEGYFSYFCSAERKGYSGVAAYSKYQPVSVKCGMGIEEFDSEGRVIEIEYSDFILLNVYFPNGKASKERLDYKMNFYDAFLNHIEELRSQGKKVVFCGDVNTAHKEIDLARPKENENISGFLPIEREWIDKVIDKGYIDTFRVFNSEGDNYSWWDYKTKARQRNVGWRIDYFFISEDLKKNLKKATIMNEVMGSDHCPIEIVLEF
jgi:exodeoxyribonuclease-3